MNWTWFHKLASPPHFYRLAGRITPWLGWPAFLLIVIGLYGGLVLAPPDYQQGDAFRIVYVHAPSAWMSMFIYGMMAIAAAIGLIWRIKLAHAVAAAAAPVGAWFTFVTLVTGSLWGRPMWGTWWQWDARMTSELILLFLYLGLIALRASIDDRERADRASAVLALVGVVNLPIIHYSVYWWNTLHQGSTITKFGKPSITFDMLWPLLVMFVAFKLFFGMVLMLRVRGEVLRRERDASWLREELTR
ncbi:MAG: heme ABC transporter permease CcmC [Gammaproteobacteria bacterium]|nr:heme ABC transporter permease CcmC [Gammaproteobacteria bacterium]